MKWAGIIIRTLVGGMFLFASITYFLNLMPNTPPEGMPEDAVQFGAILGKSGYLNVVKVLELVGGALLVSGLFVGLGITILTPISVNILLFETLVAKQPGPGVVMTVLCFALVGIYWKHFRAAFARTPMPGCCNT